MRYRMDPDLCRGPIPRDGFVTDAYEEHMRTLLHKLGSYRLHEADSGRRTLTAAAPMTQVARSSSAHPARPMEQLRQKPQEQSAEPTSRRKQLAQASRKQLAQAIAHASTRPLLVAVEDLAVRRSADMSSEFIVTLPAGTRLSVVESRPTQDGGKRARVMVLASCDPGADDKQRARQGYCYWLQLQCPNKPLGWVTERGREGRSLLSDPSTLSTPPRTPSTVLALNFPGSEKEKRSEAPTRKAEAAPAAVAKGGSPAPAAARRFGALAGGKLGGLKALLGKAVAAEGMAVPAAPTQAGESSSDFASLVKAAVKEFSCPGGGLGPKAGHLAVEDACKAILALYADKKSNVFRVSDVEAECAIYERAAEKEEKAASATSLSAQIGEVLSAKGAKKLDDLVKEWDPNSDGSVTKQEFRVCVRKLFKKAPDVKEVRVPIGRAATHSLTR